MANALHLEVLRRGVPAWNRWRAENPRLIPDLSGAPLAGARLPEADFSRALLLKADLSEAELEGTRLDKAILGEANLRAARLAGAGLSGAELHRAVLAGADLSGAALDHAICIDCDLRAASLVGASLNRTVFRGADLREADLRGAAQNATDFSGADLSGADLSDVFAGGALLSGAKLVAAKLESAVLSQADMRGAILQRARLGGADLTGANLEGADLSGADLSGADLSRAQLARANLTNARIADCAVFGASLWGVDTQGARQSNLMISDMGESLLAVDDLAIAQFVHLMLQHPSLRDIVSQVSSRLVLVLGHFPEPRLPILRAIREGLRQLDYAPIVYDHEPRRGQEVIETILTLGRLARFIIADLTDADSVAHELRAVVPDLTWVPVQPLLVAGAGETKVIDQLLRYSTVLPIHRYHDREALAAALQASVIGSAEGKVAEVEPRRRWSRPPGDWSRP